MLRSTHLLMSLLDHPCRDSPSLCIGAHQGCLSSARRHHRLASAVVSVGLVQRVFSACHLSLRASRATFLLPIDSNRARCRMKVLGHLPAPTRPARTRALGRSLRRPLRFRPASDLHRSIEGRLCLALVHRRLDYSHRVCQIRRLDLWQYARHLSRLGRRSWLRSRLPRPHSRRPPHPRRIALLPAPGPAH